MSRLPRNRELEHMLIDVLRSTPVESSDRQEAWQVYADWLLALGEPVGEWLAASLRADDGGEAAAPIRAALHEIEVACRFRLVDLELADLSEVPELARIADLTWERGFITSAAVHCRKFRAFDSELLEHTPDRLLDVVLRSPSAVMLHRLELDTYRFVGAGSRVASFAELLMALPEDLSLRSLALGDLETEPYRWTRVDTSMHLGADTFARVPQLRELSLQATKLHVSEPLVLPKLGRLSVRAEQPTQASSFEQLAPLCDGSGVPALTELELSLAGLADRMTSRLIDSPLLDRLSVLRIEHLTEVGAAAICEHARRFKRIGRFEVAAAALPDSLIAGLRALGCSVALTPRTS
jgi:hypothetical protein